MKGILHGRCTLILQILAAELNIFKVLKSWRKKGVSVLTLFLRHLFSNVQHRNGVTDKKICKMLK